jgi:hypothetical protein
MTTRATILLVEDHEDDIFLMRRALKEAGIINPLQVVEMGSRHLIIFQEPAHLLVETITRSRL